MAEGFLAEIIAPSRMFLGGLVKSIVYPAWDGERQVFANHADFTGRVGTGLLTAQTDSGERCFVISEGLVEITDGNFSLLAALCEDFEQVDVAAESERLASLREGVNKKSLPASEIEELMREIALADARVRGAEKMRTQKGA